MALFVLLAGLALGSAASAQVQVGAALDLDEVPVGQSVRFTVTVIGADREIVPPTLPDLPGVNAFGAGQSQRFSFVNGQSRAEYSWSWSLVPVREGVVTIPSIKVGVDGRDYETMPRTLTATAARTPPDPGDLPEDAPAQDLPDAFVTMAVDRDTVVIGEQVVLTFGFYRASRTSMFESPEYTAPRTEGFWREDLPPERHRREVVRSRRFEVTEIQYALFPTRTGDLTISEATVRLPEDAFGSFFRRTQPRRGPSILQTEPITVHVDPLPLPQPADFTGTVATDLRLRSSVDRRELEQGDALTWRVRLEGAGHLEAASLPLPELGPGFSVHESSSSSESGPDGGRLRGSRTVEYLVIPQQPGELAIPALDYSWFDTSRREYVRARTAAIPIRVTPSEGGVASVFTGGRKSEIELLARDILHIEPVGAQAKAWEGPLPRRTAFWATASGVPLLWGLSFLVARRREQLLADPRRLRARRARAVALRLLAEDRPVDQRVSAAVEGYLADRFDRSASGLVRDEIESILRKSGVPDDLVRSTRELLERCDALRYAPGGVAAETLLTDARALVDRLEEVLDA
jgi:hypothetical protein